MVFLKELHVRFQGFHEVVSQAVVIEIFAYPSMPMENAVGVGIHYERGVKGCVKDDAVRRFRSYSMDLEELPAQGAHFPGKEGRKVSLPPHLEILAECLQLSGFLIVIARRTDHWCQL
jgi:hypothetical protein